MRFRRAALQGRLRREHCTCRRTGVRSPFLTLPGCQSASTSASAEAGTRGLLLSGGPRQASRGRSGSGEATFPLASTVGCEMEKRLGSLPARLSDRAPEERAGIRVGVSTLQAEQWEGRDAAGKQRPTASDGGRPHPEWHRDTQGNGI